MCVITDANHIVVSISFIRGVDAIPDGFHVYEFVKGIPSVGDFYKTVEASNYTAKGCDPTTI